MRGKPNALLCYDQKISQGECVLSVFVGVGTAVLTGTSLFTSMIV